MRNAQLSRVVVLLHEFVANLEFWGWLSAEGVRVRGGSLVLVLITFTDASKAADGGFMFRYVLDCFVDIIFHSDRAVIASVD